MSIHLRDKKRGFTTIELLVAIAIIIVLPSIVISNFPQIKLQFSLSRTAHKFIQEVRRTQDMALSSIQYYDNLGVAQLIAGYGIYIDIDALGNKKYLIYADHIDEESRLANRFYEPLDYTFQEVDFSVEEPGIVIKEINHVFGNTLSINFNPPKPDTVITSLNANETKVEVVFAMESDLLKTKTVSINTSGLIEVE